MLAVVGAKLSEGLNFSDELARAVVVVGLPYPNLYSAELQERLKYVTELSKTQHGSHSKPARDAGAELYENLCMKAVNQSIGESPRYGTTSLSDTFEGRAIRHRNDWSSLILLDSRYSTDRVRNKLPGWISGSIITTQTFGQAVKALGAFYHAKKIASNRE